MRFDSELIPGLLIRRHQRFLVDIELADQSIVTAHCPSTGSMRGCLRQGWQVRLSRSPNQARKYPLTLEMIHNGRCWIAINTQHANRLAIEAIHTGVISELAGFGTLKNEARYSAGGVASRIDLLLGNKDHERKDDSKDDRRNDRRNDDTDDSNESIAGVSSPSRATSCYVEIKTVTMLDQAGRYAFPDAVTRRGRKHLGALTAIAAEGQRAVMLYLINRSDGHAFRIASEIDPDYEHAFSRALTMGVEVLAYQVDVSPAGLRVSEAVPILASAHRAGTGRPSGATLSP